jgi:hypothetical protein
MQNMARAEWRASLSSLGEGVKCICLGDIHQMIEYSTVNSPLVNPDRVKHDHVSLLGKEKIHYTKTQFHVS